MPRLTTLATAAILLFISVGPLRAQVKKNKPAYTADDPHALKVWGMPKANRKYVIADVPSGTNIPAEYSSCGNGVYYIKEKVRGVDVTVVIVHFQAEGDFELTYVPMDLSKPSSRPGFEKYIPPGWVSLTFTLRRDAVSLQEIRLIRRFPLHPVPGTELQRSSFVIGEFGTRVNRSWVDKDPYVTWEILPESQLSQLIFKVRLPESTKECLQNKK